MKQERARVGDWVAICCASDCDEIKTQEQADDINRELEEDRSQNIEDTYFIFESYEELREKLGRCGEE